MAPLNSAPDTVTITTVNVAPVANAGPDQGGKAPGSLITLNGSASSDANGDPLTYSWSLIPAGRQRRGPVESHQRVADLYRRPRRQLYGPAHRQRWHREQRTRHRDHHHRPMSRRWPTPAPTKAARPRARLITLNGSASSDANGDPLTYSWSLSPASRQHRGPVESHQRERRPLPSTSPAAMWPSSSSTMAP